MKAQQKSASSALHIALNIYLYFYWARQEPYSIRGLVVRVPGYRPRGPGFDYRRYHIF
jgi:hypothetical protein